MDKGENAERPGPPGLGMERAVLGPWEQTLGTSTFSFVLAPAAVSGGSGWGPRGGWGVWGDSSCGRQGEATSLSSFKAEGGEIHMMLACISKRTSWLLRAEEMGLKWKQERRWGDPKGSAILKNPESLSPSPCGRCAAGPDPAFPTC